jgi:hypothetical protein
LLFALVEPEDNTGIGGHPIAARTLITEQRKNGQRLVVGDHAIGRR